ncbi:MAG: tRNA (adenosine(37)-N6)-dimethylallyltransferase MiaA [Bacteroides sp.]|nr:tRNA (adenosine(37)-N6)-dimethylallyltransferase MiaA [Bacillota bacterium]MCM1393869.1 tRNA (adenosine(37)-N6)-dimethylallyltransferase MiaA [[Eubacterium] siraeum]MCM1455834.1 tRNA (adenosine(37)-N6)-dimethylallyltransferase MiaA [Bacteroides sp.]
MSKKFSKPVFIAGPTASGKSALALRLAEEFDCVIISADSMQIYRGLDIGTAKVSRAIRDKVEHKLIDIVDYDEEFSVARFSELARAEIESAINKGKLPIVVGGTGLYFEALLYPMSFGHTVKNEELRQTLNSEYKLYGAQYLHDKLRALDAETADRLHANDVKRVIRALEIVITTGKTMKENGDVGREEPNVIMVALNTDREKLYEKINKRVDIMFDNGLVAEALSAGRFDCQSMQAIGYKEFANCHFTIVGDQYVIDKNELERIKELIKQHTRNYAKRQLTWFKKYKFIKWFDCDDLDEAASYIKEQLNE